MLWPILGSIFSLTLLLAVIIIICAIFNFKYWRENKSSVFLLSGVWSACYGLFILFFTGPVNLNSYPPQHSSEYKLPWAGGVSRFVAQGNRSFTSHRGAHLYAWDFVMPNGTKILASRNGIVHKVTEQYSGVGLKSNVIIVKHNDGQYSGYAHIKKGSSFVAVGDRVYQGQPLALSGMVGQTVFPHVHFFVTDVSGTNPIKVSFKDVKGGVPLAGSFYESENLPE